MRQLSRMIAVLGAVCCTACSTPASVTEVTHHPPQGWAPSAAAVVDRLENDGKVVLHPMDTTSTDCAGAGCEQVITTDRFRIMSFSTTGNAQIYAADRGLRQVETLVVDFSPTVAEPARDRLWSQISQLVG